MSAFHSPSAQKLQGAPKSRSKKFLHRRTKCLGDPIEPRGGDSVYALLDFLNLLKRNANAVAKGFLREPLLQTDATDIAANKGVHGVSGAGVFGLATHANVVATYARIGNLKC